MKALLFATTLLLAGTAYADPIQLPDDAMDRVTAGGYKIGLEGYTQAYNEAVAQLNDQIAYQISIGAPYPEELIAGMLQDIESSFPNTKEEYKAFVKAGYQK